MRTCEVISRRRLMTVGGLGVMGLTLADALRADDAGPPGKTPPSCIFVWLDGGPTQYETFDPKPEASAEVRGPYGAIATNVKGIRISELLPTLAGQVGRFGVLPGFAHTLDRRWPIRGRTGSATQPAAFGAVVTAFGRHSAVV